MASIVSGGGVPLCSFARFSVGHHMLDLDSSYGFGRQNFRPALGAHMFILLGQLPVSHAELLSTMGSTEDVSILNCCADKAHAIRTLIFKQSLVGLGFVCMLGARGRRTRWHSRRVGTRFRLSRSLGCRGCRRLALLGLPAHLQCDLASDFVQDVFLAHLPAAACQPVGSVRCRTCEDSVAETYIAHLRAVLPDARLRANALNCSFGRAWRQALQVQHPRAFVAHARQMRRLAARVFHADRAKSAATLRCLQRAHGLRISQVRQTRYKLHCR